MFNKKVSIIMPLYNSEKYIKESIESVVNQTYSDWELLICDDCSSDDSLKLVRELQKRFKKYDIRVFELKENKGVVFARNICLQQSRGRYIAFLDSDDIWKKEKLTHQINFMQQNSYYFTVTQYSKIDGNSKDLNRIIDVETCYNLKKLLLNGVGNSTVVYDSYGIGKPEITPIKKRNDYLYWINILMKFDINIYGIKQNLSSHRIHNDSLSSSKLTLVKYHWDIYHSYLNYSIFESTFLCIHWIKKGFFQFFKSKFNEGKVKGL